MRRLPTARLVAVRLQLDRFMYRAFIALVDASRARLFELVRRNDDGVLRETFVELVDLVNPAGRLRASEQFSDTRARNAPPARLASRPQQGYDDHREAHIDQFEAKFAVQVAHEIDRLLRERATERLIVCAPPRMLGMLHGPLHQLHREGLVIEQVGRDLGKLATLELRVRLAEYGLLPPRPSREDRMRAGSP